MSGSVIDESFKAFGVLEEAVNPQPRGIRIQIGLNEHCVFELFYMELFVFLPGIPEPLPGDAFYELYLPLGVPRLGRGELGECRRRGLRAWIRYAVEVLQCRAPGRRRLPPHWYELDYFSGRPDGWDREFTLARSSDGVLPPRKAGSLALLVGSPEEEEPPFVEDLGRAFARKCPKLARCKALDLDVVTVLILEAIDPPFHYDRYVARHLGGLLQGCDVEPDRIFVVSPHAVFWAVWVVKIDDVRWPDERLPMPHKGYQDPPKLVPEHAYPKHLVEQFNRGVGREVPAKWRPLFADEAELDDIKGATGGAPARMRAAVREGAVAGPRARLNGWRDATMMSATETGRQESHGARRT